MHYTPSQTRWFLAAIERAERERIKAAGISARVSQAEAKHFKDWLGALDAEPRG